MTPDEIAAELELSQENYEKLYSEIVSSIFESYRNTPLRPTTSLEDRVRWAEQATDLVLSNLAHFHYTIVDPDGPQSWTHEVQSEPTQVLEITEEPVEPVGVVTVQEVIHNDDGTTTIIGEDESGQLVGMMRTPGEWVERLKKGPRQN